MATLYIEEYEHVLSEAQLVPDALLAKQKVAISGASAPSAAFNAKTRFVRLCSDVPCQWEEAATADADSRFLPANVPEGFKATGGSIIAVIAQQ